MVGAGSGGIFSKELEDSCMKDEKERERHLLGRGQREIQRLSGSGRGNEKGLGHDCDWRFKWVVETL